MSLPVDAKDEAEVWVVEPDATRSCWDQLATEEPLEIRLRAAGTTPLVHHTVAITMRTPGSDLELAAGFLFGEGVIRGRDEVHEISHCTRPDLDEARRSNVVNVDLNTAVLPDLETLQRHFYTTSACGVCGKKSLDALKLKGPAAVSAGPLVDAETLRALPGKLREGQSVFAATGGLHAAALFDADGRLLAVREDVGRHNAVDKLVGWAFLEGRLPLGGHILLVSGRTSFEILQKAVMAGVPFVCAISAPSTLAVAVAREHGMTLIGFLRGERFNVYAGVQRLSR